MAVLGARVPSVATSRASFAELGSVLPAISHACVSLLFLLAFVLVASASAQAPRPLGLDDNAVGALEAGGAAIYTLDLEAETFVYGEVDQLIGRCRGDGDRSPTARRCARSMSPDAAHESFQFESETAGIYTIRRRALRGRGR